MIQIEPQVYLLAALLVLTLPLDWLLAAFFAATIHEICHAAAIILLGGKIFHIQIGICGASMETEIAGNGRELVSALAGPAGSLCLLCLCHVCPKLAICACIQAMFNLLPVYPLDGGRILRCILEMLCPRKAKEIENLFMFCAVILLVSCSFSFSVPLIPALIAILLILKARM